MGEGTRPATNQHLLLAKAPGALERGREGRRWRALPHTLSQAWHLWSDLQKDTPHNHQATVCNQSSENLAPVTSCPSQKGHLTAAGPPRWLIFRSVRILESDPSRRTTSSTNTDCPGNHTSATKVGSLWGRLPGCSPHRLQVYAARLSLWALTKHAGQ